MSSVQSGSVGVAGRAAIVLRSERVRFAPALGRVDGSTWTLRDALLTALGCDRTAGPLSYWQWEDLYVLLRTVRAAIESHVNLPLNMNVEQWANQSGRRLEEVLQALDAVSSDEDVPVPSAPTLRPWCDPRVVSRCRVPFIPLGALAHAWGDADRPWSDVAEEVSLTEEMTSWDMLRRIDPVIRDTPPAAGVSHAAWVLRAWKILQYESLSPARWMLLMAAEDPSVTLEQLLGRAQEEIDAAERQATAVG